MNKRLAIVIPIYKETPSAVDIISLKRFNSILVDKYDVFIVAPTGLNLDHYKEYITFSVKYFPKKYFKGLKGYSSLCLSQRFYSAFKKYEYMLIHQTDCYMISDKLEEWMDKGYDYCGAPILSVNYDWGGEPNVGNGGFSLRKISKFLEITDPSGDVMTAYSVAGKNIDDVLYEDVWFCYEMIKYTKLSRPTLNEACDFAWDMNPEVLVVEYLKPWPMAIHAIDKNIALYTLYTRLVEDLDNKEVVEEIMRKFDADNSTKAYIKYQLDYCETYKDKFHV